MFWTLLFWSSWCIWNITIMLHLMLLIMALCSSLHRVLLNSASLSTLRAITMTWQLIAQSTTFVTSRKGGRTKAGGWDPHREHIATKALIFERLNCGSHETFHSYQEIFHGNVDFRPGSIFFVIGFGFCFHLLGNLEKCLYYTKKNPSIFLVTLWKSLCQPVFWNSKILAWVVNLISL